MNIEQLMDRYSSIKASLEKAEEGYKAYKKEWEEHLSATEKEILTHMSEHNLEKIEAHNGTFRVATNAYVSVSNTATFTQWLKQDIERLQYATIKARSLAVKKYVEEKGVAPDGVKHEKIKEILFRRS